MQQRIITAVIALAILYVVLFQLPGDVTELIIAALLLAGAWEWSGFLGVKSAATRAAYVGLVAVAFVVAGFFIATHTQTVLLVGVVWWLAAFVWTFFFPTPIPHWFRWLAGMIVLVPLYLALIVLYRADPMLLLFVLLIVWMADIGAYFAGRFFGRVKLAPAISPGKTWEGVIGGLLAVVALTLVRSVWVETNLAVMLPFCLAIASISIVGDLTVSMFKRTAGVKDSGMLFPGHGGVLDRIDSVAAAAPLFAFGLAWVGLS
ncbi:MAG: phosphatidate cytidylyltransferase [Pseudomonadota bacterium]